MSTIKPPAAPIAPSIPSAPASSVTTAAPAQTASAAQAPVLSPEAIAEAVRKYKKLREQLKNPLKAGASGLFTDNITFPAELLDPNDPANDPKYLHLLFAMFGLQELERYFATPEQEEEKKREDESQDSEDADA